MKSDPLLLCATALLLSGSVSGQDRTTVTHFEVVETTVTACRGGLGVVFNQASLSTASHTTTTQPLNGLPEPTASIDYTLTPVGTADSGSETTYSLHEVISLNPHPSSGDVQPYTVKGTLVKSVSGYHTVESQVFNPTSSGTEGVISGNCTYNDGSGDCLQVETGKPNDSSTYTGGVIGSWRGQDQTTVTFFDVLPSDRASLFTASRTSTTRPSNGFPEPTASIGYTITPVGTADSGSETTYSFHEVISINPDPSSGDVQPYTAEGTLVESASGYRLVDSQVFNPTSSGTITAGVFSGNCTFNEDGSGICLQTEAGDSSDTATLTGVVIPVMTMAFDINDNHAVGLGHRGIEKAWLIGTVVMMLMFVI
ncbi:hypothetical protein K435DRAFT_972836 [Dendrothele bispora CBS 962.96]|uniref:Uncharacterized protein n=1 Tax=Dendrothele bispora (strain CBS 962.96) TaxID=1314807 RepID=A0A4S8KWD2_DENBC|nr:hypothetical protein K435DRAFT_972836 [Dendrothele bispora CBS 962.96]